MGNLGPGWGEEMGFFPQEKSGRIFLFLRKRHRDLVLVLDWWVVQFLTGQISFPWTTHLLLRPTRALAFLPFSPIILCRSCLIPPCPVGMWVLPVLGNDPVIGQCYRKRVWTI